MPEADKCKEGQYTDRRKEHFSSPSDKTIEIYKKKKKGENILVWCLWGISFKKKGLFFKDKVCFECGSIGHKSSHCWYKQKRKKEIFF